MKNKQTNEGSVKQSSAPTDLVRLQEHEHFVPPSFAWKNFSKVKFLASFLESQCERIDCEGFVVENDVPVVEEVFSQLEMSWKSFVNEYPQK
ncbi:hypothetical protein N9H57_01645 [Flavobacteriaceae bacterium]|nr:hypothetical protein [Flavobacteriaceae bacterium]MDA7797556.1 hypothetical protein [Flavobacteriaceae bacterium]MDA8947822.1 hypothetical protein [Flavobacteriaceae bacterium]MDA9572317.1 hypothetical protein [Flavobacteriaceae bacterium]